MAGRPKMHAGEVGTSSELLRTLLREQFPEWSELPIRLVESYGTDHDIYRLGPDLSVRMPRIDWAMTQADLEAHWLPKLARQLPLRVPTPIALGEPGHDYPFRWAVHEWLPGSDANAPIADLEQAAVDLAGFVRALQAVDAAGAPTPKPGQKGGPLAPLDEHVRSRMVELEGKADTAAMLRSWEESLEADAWTGPDVLLHADLLPGNLLFDGGRLAAVIDWGGLTAGDPAIDLVPVWHTFRGPSGRTYLDALGVDEATRLRARGWVVGGAVFGVGYYWDTNPGIVRQTLAAVDAALAGS